MKSLAGVPLEVLGLEDSSRIEALFSAVRAMFSVVRFASSSIRVL
jgi:hypothetical protein